MKNSISNKFGRIRIVCMTIGVLSLASCMKNNGPVEDFSKSPAVVGFQYKGSSAVPMITSVLLQPDAAVNVELTLSAASLTLDRNVAVTVAADQASLDAYNSANGTSYTLVPSSNYTIDGGGTVSIAAGKQIVPMVIHLNSTALDFSTDPALAFKITNADGATVASNLNVIILPLKLRNAYEGTYTVTGYFVHPAAPRPLAATKTLSTISPIRSEGQVGDLGGFLFDFDVDGSNNLVNWAAAGSTSPASGFINGVDNATGDANYPGPPYVNTTYNNTYDPATHTFWMHYGYNGSNPAFSREVYEEWVLQ